MTAGRLITLVLCLGLAACAAQPTPYQPRDGAGGYAQQQLDTRTWRVEFAGNFATPRETVENYLMYRAAEIMLFGGYDEFALLEKDVESTVEYLGYGYASYRIGVGFHHGSRFGHYGHYGWPGPYGPDYYRPRVRYTGVATVRTVTGGRAPADAPVFSAREVVEQLGPTIVVPPDGRG